MVQNGAHQFATGVAESFKMQAGFAGVGFATVHEPKYLRKVFGE